MRRIPLDGSVTNQSYFTTYYPNTLDPSQATMVDVPPGVEVASIDIRMRRGAVYRVSGKVMGGTQEAGGNVQLTPRTDFGRISGAIGAPVGKNGLFEIPGVTPGAYTLNVSRSTGSEPGQATVALDVSADVDDITLTPQPGFTVSGSISFPGVDKPDFKSVGIYFQSDFMRIYAPRSETKADGTFTISPLWPGRYRLNVLAGTEMRYLASVMWNDRDVSGEELEFSSAASGIKLIIREDVSTVSGVAATGVVILVPVEARRVAMEHVRIGTATNGRFKIEGVPPGDYHAFALEDLESLGIWHDADWRKANEGKFKRVTVPAKGSATVDVEVIQSPGGR